MEVKISPLENSVITTYNTFFHDEKWGLKLKMEKSLVIFHRKSLKKGKVEVGQK